ncbi:MAG: hypothetical protein KY055_00645, partial [Candidatus Nealsonbacteria bacterium]|nr:hypothetical protein [Candidatus Nealsonbacteria bacterium]
MLEDITKEKFTINPEQIRTMQKDIAELQKKTQTGEAPVLETKEKLEEEIEKSIKEAEEKRIIKEREVREKEAQKEKTEEERKR